MEELWRCPFCEALHAWPLDIADILDGRRPPRDFTPSYADPSAVIRVRCGCGARAAVKGLVDSPLPPQPGAPYLDDEARKRSRLFSWSVRPTVYRRTNAAGRLQMVAVQWVR